MSPLELNTRQVKRLKARYETDQGEIQSSFNPGGDRVSLQLEGHFIVATTASQLHWASGTSAIDAQFVAAAETN